MHPKNNCFVVGLNPGTTHNGCVFVETNQVRFMKRGSLMDTVGVNSFESTKGPLGALKPSAGLIGIFPTQ